MYWYVYPDPQNTRCEALAMFFKWPNQSYETGIGKNVMIKPKKYENE
jgi:hypothetical protein